MTFSRLVLPCTPVLILLASSLTACQTPSAVDRDFGLAVKKAQSAQAQPSGRNTSVEAPTGTDAGIVHSTIVRYEKTYVTPPSPVTSLDQSLGTATSGTTR